MPNFSWAEPKICEKLAFELIRNACFNLEQLSHSSCLAWLGILTLKGLSSGFNSDAEIFIYYNIFCKQLNGNVHFSPFEFSLAGIKITVCINSTGHGLVICTSLNLNQVPLKKSSASEPGLKLPFFFPKKQWLCKVMTIYLIEEDRLSLELVTPWSNSYKAYGDSSIENVLFTVEGVGHGANRPQLGQDQATSSFVKRDSMHCSHLSSLKIKILQ